MQSTAARFAIRSLAKRKLTRDPIRTYSFSRTVLLAATETKSVIDGAGHRAHDSEADSDWVKNAINQILQTYSTSLKSAKDGNDSISSSNSQSVRRTSVVSDEDLDKAVQYFQYRLKEAQLCVTDCKECENTAILAEEVASAEKAIAASVGCFVDLLDAIREGGGQQSERVQIIREEAVNAIRDVRADLNEFKQRIA